MKKKNKIILIIVITILLIALIITFLFLRNESHKTTYENNDITLYITQYYAEEGVDNVLDYPLDNFGIIEDYAKEATYMANFDIDNYNKEELEFDPIAILFINNLDKDGIKIVKEELESYLYGMAYISTDKDEIELYETGIVESGKNYVYMIIGPESETINEEIKLMGKK